MQSKESPARELRLIQSLLVNGIFPGSIAPEVVKGYAYLENMASDIERKAGWKEVKQ